MRIQHRLLHALTALLVASLVGIATRDGLQSAGPSPITITSVKAQLRQLFTTWDLDGDGYLDKQELAKAFRGSDAKPFDSGKSGDQGAASLMLFPSALSAATPALTSTFGVAQPYSASVALMAYFARPNATGPAKASYNSFPDYIFLTNLDTDRDQKISKAEWDAWARSYAIQLKAIAAAQNKVTKAKQRVSNAKTLASQRRAQAALLKLQNELTALNKKSTAADKKIQQAMATTSGN